jgi:hypothetical protein
MDIIALIVSISTGRKLATVQKGNEVECRVKKVEIKGCGIKIT